MIPSYVTPVLVTGTITSIPSGTQDVNIISPTILDVNLVSPPTLNVNLITPSPVPVTGTVDVNILTPNPLPVTFSGGTVSTSVVTRVASAVTSHLLVAANPLRKGLLFYNDSTAYQYVKLGTVASGIDFTVRLVPQVFYEVATPIYLGQIDVISSSTNGAIQVTELS